MTSNDTGLLLCVLAGAMVVSDHPGGLSPAVAAVWCATVLTIAGVLVAPWRRR